MRKGFDIEGTVFECKFGEVEGSEIASGVVEEHIFGAWV